MAAVAVVPTVAECVAATTAAARRHGVPTGSRAVLSTGANVLVRMGDLVARTPRLTTVARPDPGLALARDVDLAAFLAARGVPVVPPSTDPPAGPHRVGRRAVTFWRYVRHDPGAVPSPATVGRSLARLHTAIRAFPPSPANAERPGLPSDVPLAEVHRLLEVLSADSELDAGTLARLRGDADDLGEAIRHCPGPRHPLHGDAHPGNLLRTEDGWLWTDFEDAWNGPVAWDLAVLRRTSRVDGAAAVAAYAGVADQVVDEEVLAPFVRLRELSVVCWQLVAGLCDRGRAQAAVAGLRRYLTRPDTSR